MARETVWGATDEHVDFPGSDFSQGMDPASGRRSPDDGVFHYDHTLTLQEFLDRIEFHLDPEIAHALGRLDKGPSNVMVPDDAHLKWDAGCLGITDSRVIA